MTTHTEPTGHFTAVVDADPTVPAAPFAAPDVDRARSPLHSVPQDLSYLTGGFVLSVISFILLITLFSVGLSLAAVVIGLPVLALSLLMASSFARENRRLLAAWQGSPVPAPPYGRPTTRRMWGTLGDPQLWKELLHGTVISLPVRITTFSIAVSWLVGGLGGLTYVLWGLFLPDDGGLAELISGPLGVHLPWSAHLANSMLNFVAGAIMVLTAPFVIRTMAGIDASLARVFLTDHRS
ncbi:sensor domain-containing protein [Propionibacteriaceae bacterium Y1685]|uniref:sensor domain-containing protein n=1 Tax=Microlunatus sp. Y1700 TaxID=3418487 RepID=UPI003B824A01